MNVNKSGVSTQGNENILKILCTVVKIWKQLKLNVHWLTKEIKI